MISKRSLDIGSELAKGSFGSVYTVTSAKGTPDKKNYVYKEYKPYVRPDSERLSSFADFYYSLTTDAKEYLDTVCSWPQVLVKDDGAPSGFLMPRIPEKFYCYVNFSSGLKKVEAKFEHLLMPEALLKRRQIPLTKKKRYELLRSVVRELDFLHEHEISIGDFSHSNILFSLSDCTVFFLDCDSYSVKGESVFPQTETGNWGVAERYPDEKLGTKKSDIYKLGLLALRLLMRSDNSSYYQATTNTDRLPSEVDLGVRTVIENSLKDADDRPSLAEWGSALIIAIEECGDEVETGRPSVVVVADGIVPKVDSRNGLYGYINKEGNWVIRPRFSDADSFSEGLALARDANTELYGFINAEGDWVIEPQFSSARSFSSGLAPAWSKVARLYGYINTRGEWVIKPHST